MLWPELRRGKKVAVRKDIGGEFPPCTGLSGSRIRHSWRLWQEDHEHRSTASRSSATHDPHPAAMFLHNPIRQPQAQPGAAVLFGCVKGFKDMWHVGRWNATAKIGRASCRERV